MADEIPPQAQAATEPSPTAGEQPVAPATEQTAPETNANLNPDPAAQAVPVEEMDAKAYAELERELIEHGLPEEQSPEPAAPATPEPVKTEKVEQPKIPNEDDEETGTAPKRIRLTDLADAERETVALVRDMKKAGTPISFTEAEKRVHAKYGITDKQPETAQSAATETPETLQAKLDQLLKDEEQAANDVDSVRQLKVGREIRETEKALERARTEQERATQAAATALNERRAQMRELFPDFKDKNSALSKEWAAEHDRLQAINHPFLADPAEAVEFITLKVAKKLGISPVSPVKTPAKAPASISPTVTKPMPPVRPASGSQRTQTPTNATGQIEQMIDGAKSDADIRRLEKLVLAGG